MQAKPPEPVRARIDKLDAKGAGLTWLQGRWLAVPGTLPGETIRVRPLGQRRAGGEGALLEVLSPSPARVEPRCPHFHACGGCSLQHMDHTAQLALKEQRLREALWQYGQLEAESWLPPVTGAPWGYRRRARLGVKYVAKKGGALVGYREKRGSLLADLTRCETLHPLIGQRIQRLRELIGQLQSREHIPQIEIAVGERSAALVIRHLVKLHPSGPERIKRVCAQRSAAHVPAVRRTGNGDSPLATGT